MKAKVRKIKKEIPEKKFIGLELKTFLFESKPNCANIINSIKVNEDNVVDIINTFCSTIRIPFIFNTTVNEREAFKSVINDMMDCILYRGINANTNFKTYSITNVEFRTYASDLYEITKEYLNNIYKQLLNGDDIEMEINYDIGCISIKPIWR